MAALRRASVVSTRTAAVHRQRPVPATARLRTAAATAGPSASKQPCADKIQIVPKDEAFDSHHIAGSVVATAIDRPQQKPCVAAVTATATAAGLLWATLLPAGAAAAEDVSPAAPVIGPLVPPPTVPPAVPPQLTAEAKAAVGGLAHYAGKYAGLFSYGASVGIAVALMVEAVPLVTLARRLTPRRALMFSAGTTDAPGRLRWLGMTVLSGLPVTCWAAWLLAAWSEGPSTGLRGIYLAYSALYALPLAAYSDGFSHVGPAAVACWLACALHVQVHRVLRTNRVL